MIRGSCVTFSFSELRSPDSVFHGSLSDTLELTIKKQFSVLLFENHGASSEIKPSLMIRGVECAHMKGDLGVEARRRRKMK